MNNTITITDANGNQVSIPDGANIQLPDGSIVSARQYALDVKHSITNPNYQPKYSQQAIDADRNNLWNLENWAGK